MPTPYMGRAYHMVHHALLVSVLICAMFAMSAGHAHAQVPFGGRSLGTIPCTCGPSSGCFQVTVGPPKAGVYMYCPHITQLKMNYNIFPPAWQLGLTAGFMTCEQAFSGCTPVGGGLLMILDGTSLY